MIIGDSSVGTRRLSSKALEDRGVQYIKLTPKDNFKETVPGYLRFTVPWRKSMNVFVEPRDRFAMITLTILATLTALFHGYLAITLPSALQHPREEILTWLALYFIGTTTLGVISSILSAKLRLNLSISLSTRLLYSLPFLDRNYFTYGDGFTRYQDVQTVVGLIVHVLRDIPYALFITVIACTYLYRLNSFIMFLLIGIVVLIGAGIFPLISKIQDMTYQNRINLSRFMNEFRQIWANKVNQGVQFWDRYLTTSYKQSLLNIPSGMFLSHLPMLGVLVIVVSLKTNSQWHQILTFMMLTNYVSSGIRRLYSEYVAWRMARPSLIRLYEAIDSGKGDNNQNIYQRLV